MSRAVANGDSAADCKHDAGRFVPRIDRNRCEGKDDCVRVCPYAVFELGVLAPQDRRGLSLKGRIKGAVHGWKQAFAVNAADCHACGLCVQACPERAITLVRADPLDSGGRIPIITA